MLARKGLLAFALESEMSKPVVPPLAPALAPSISMILASDFAQIMIGKGFEVETAKRNLDATGGFHINRLSKDLTGDLTRRHFHLACPITEITRIGYPRS